MRRHHEHLPGMYGAPNPRHEVHARVAALERHELAIAVAVDGLQPDTAVPLFEIGAGASSALRACEAPFQRIGGEDAHVGHEPRLEHDVRRDLGRPRRLRRGDRGRRALAGRQPEGSGEDEADHRTMIGTRNGTPGGRQADRVVADGECDRALDEVVPGRGLRIDVDRLCELRRVREVGIVLLEAGVERRPRLSLPKRAGSQLAGENAEREHERAPDRRVDRVEAPAVFDRRVEDDAGLAAWCTVVSARTRHVTMSDVRAGCASTSSGTTARATNRKRTLRSIGTGDELATQRGCEGKRTASRRVHDIDACGTPGYRCGEPLDRAPRTIGRRGCPRRTPRSRRREPSPRR